MREIQLKVKDLKDFNQEESTPTTSTSTPTATPTKPLYNLWGIFKYEESQAGRKLWKISDETCPEGIHIRVNCAILPQYNPSTGDIVRIHRLIYDNVNKTFAITHQRNLVYWKSFTYPTEPITEAKKPTLTSEDVEAQRTLENYYCSRLVALDAIPTLPFEQASFLQFAGRVQDKNVDKYGHICLVVNDGTSQITLRVYQKVYPKDTSLHYHTAETIEFDDDILVIGGKYDSKTNLVGLSANLYQGRGIRKVDKLSMLGVQLTAKLRGPEEPNTSGFIGQILEPSNPPRRSPRLKNPSSNSSQEAPSSQTSQRITSTQPAVAQNKLDSSQDKSRSSSQPPAVILSPTPRRPTNQSPHSRPVSFLPNVKRLADIPRIQDGAYQFFNIVGQVRGTPNVTSTFGNLVFQITDGSKLDYSCYFESEVADPIPNCVTILVYSQQKPQDTNVHIKVAEKLQEGDLVSIVNIKAIWKDDKLKLEMNPYVAHGKSINVIDKDTDYGIRLLEIVSNPIVEELEENTQLTGDDSTLSVH